jgi:tellurite resistance protein
VASSTTGQPTFLEFLPVSLFGGVMGLCGLCFAWRQACELWHINRLIGELIGFIAILAFIVLTVTYLAKCFKFPQLIRQELNNPVSVCFFATFIICLLLLPGILLPYLPLLAKIMWCTGTFLIFLFALYVLRKLIDHQQIPENALPVWVLPVVGTLDVPVVGNRFTHEGVHEICLMFFGIGLVFAIILITIILSRIFFQNPLPEATQPTLLILTGPFALAFTCYEGLSGTQDLFAAVLFYFNIFLLLLLGSKIALIPKACPFRVSWWSVSFPLTAVTISSFMYAKHHTDWVHQLLAVGLLTGSTVVIIYIFFLTLSKIIKGTFVPRI